MAHLTLTLTKTSTDRRRDWLVRVKELKKSLLVRPYGYMPLKSTGTYPEGRTNGALFHKII